MLKTKHDFMLIAHIYGFKSFYSTVAVNGAQTCMLSQAYFSSVSKRNEGYMFICMRYCLFKNIARILISLLVMASAVECKMQLMTCF